MVLAMAPSKFLARLALATAMVGSAAGALSLAAGLTMTGAGCLTKACDGTFVSTAELPEDAAKGGLLDENTWQSSPIDGEWIAFPHQIRLELRHPLGRQPYEVLIWISAQKNPLEASNFTLAGGDSATVFRVLPGNVAIQNGTCADYFVRVVLRAAPAARPADAVTEAGEGGTGGGLDASVDASRDGGAD